LHDRADSDSPLRAILHDWPIAVPPDYLDLVNQPQTATEERAMLVGIRRGRPFGGAVWQQQTIEKLGLQSSTNPMHRPTRTPAPPSKTAGGSEAKNPRTPRK
jgi:hypothetical protein